MNEKKNFDYKRLHPFKWFILENYPFLEDSIDALTNYELFCKLGEMYNKQVDAINTLGIQVEDITDWFDDLDVQEEINNKLDSMVEDGTLEEIINQEIFGQINEDIDEIQKELKTKTLDNNLEYMWTHHTDLTQFQGLCVDSTSYYYYENTSHNLYKRGLNNNDLITTYNIPSFLHGNDLTKIGDIIYCANFENKYINAYNLNSGNTFNLDCLLSVSNYGIIAGIAKCDDTHVLILMAPTGANGSTKLTECGLYKVDVINNTYEALTLDTNGVNLTSISVLQSMDYVDGSLYILTSQPSMITQFVEDGNTFKCSNIFDFNDYDVNGLPYGEMEGIALLPDSFNGKGTMLIFSQMKSFYAEKNLKFYCFNPLIKLPKSRYYYYGLSETTTLNQLNVNVNATNYFENGTTNYPYKNLFDAIYSLNFSKILKYRQIQIVGAGSYYLGALRNLKAYIFSSISGVTIEGMSQWTLCDIHIEGSDSNKITLDISKAQGYSNKVNLTLKNCNIIYHQTGALTFVSSKLVIDQCSMDTYGLIAFETTVANLHFSSFTTTRADGKYMNIDRDNIVLISNMASVIPADTITKGASLVARFNNVTFS